MEMPRQISTPERDAAADSTKMRHARACAKLLILLFKHHADHASEEACAFFTGKRGAA